MLKNPEPLIGLPIVENVLNPLAKIVLIPLGLESGVSAIGEWIYKKS